jgi:hypothetical protein
MYSLSTHSPTGKVADVSIAEYPFDPGLKEGDLVSIRNLEWNKITKNSTWLEVQKGIKASFVGMVTKRKYIIEPINFNEDNFRIEIEIEIADKELFAELANIIQHNSASS